MIGWRFMAAIVASAGVVTAPVRASGSIPCGTGTFLQLRQSDAARPPAGWAALFDNLQTIGVSTVVLQWTMHGDISFVRRPATEGSVDTSVVEQILDVADRRGVSVTIGLIEDPGFWTAIGNAGETERYLQSARVELERLLPDLVPIAARHRSFAGWYITQEIDDVNWREPRPRRILTEHLAALTARLRRAAVRPVPIAISGFTNQTMEPEALASFWSSLMSDADIDVLLFQDGVGAGKLTLPSLPRYAAALYRAVVNARRQIRIVTELFDQVDGAPLNERPFAAVPAAFDRVRQQSGIAVAYSTLPPMTFSAPDYMVPSAGRAASALFQTYAANLSCR